MTHTKTFKALKKDTKYGQSTQNRNWISKPETSRGQINKGQRTKEDRKIKEKRKTPETRDKKVGKRNQEVLNIEVSKTPNSCLIYIGKTRWRALIDTGADISVISEKMYKKLQKKRKIIPNSQVLQGAGGAPLHVKGITEITFKLGNKEYSQKCYVIKEASRNLILGVDFLKKNQARIYFDLEKLRLNNEYIDLDQDIHIASVVRAVSDVTLPPQSKLTTEGKIKKGPYFYPGQLCQFAQDEKSWMSEEPGLLLANSVSELDKKSRCKVMLVNSTNKTYTIRKGCVIGTVSIVDNSELCTLAEITKKKSKDLPTEPDFTQALVPEEYRELLGPVLIANKDVFAAHDTDFGRTKTVTMKIDTKDHAPIKQRPYRTPLAQHKIVDEAVDEMLEKGIIERSNSPWASPIVLVKKKDGSTRFCVDYRKLNAITTVLAVPLPLIDDLLGVLGKAVFFTSLDLISGYWQVMMNETDKEKTAFCTSHRGLFQFKVMPFGLMNAPGVFTQLISQVLEGYEGFSTGYIDDILVFSSSLEEHMGHLNQIFQRLRQHGLKLKLRKCSFLQPETSYLGYRLTKDGIKPEDDKVKAIRELDPPTSKKQVRSFIGSCSYYRKFLPNFSGIAKPLIDLTKKNTRFKWEESHQRAFDFLKESLTEIPFLAYPDVNKPYVLYCDASDLCVGACLTQRSDEGEEMPVYFISHKLSDTQKKWATIEKESYAIFYAVQKLDYLLYGSQFVIKTDHQPLIYLLRSPSNNKKVQNWMLQLSAYNCQIEHIKGTDNTIADMLSRVPTSATDLPKNGGNVNDSGSEIDIPDQTYHVQTLNSGNFMPKQFSSYSPQKETVDWSKLGSNLDMVAEQAKDEEITQILKDIKMKKHTNKSRYMTQDGVLYYLSNIHEDPAMRLLVPLQFRHHLIVAYHDENGHFGVDKCYHTLARSYYWPKMFQDLWEHINKCTQCSQRNLRKVRPPLRETDIPPYAGAKFSLDLAGPFPVTLSGNRYVVSFVDWLSGWIEAFPVPDKTADNVIFLLQTEIIPRFSCPLVLVTDNGGENVNKAMKETLEKLRIHHVKTSVYHPQSNAKVERSHRTMNDVLCKLMTDKKCKTWDLHLPQVLGAMRFNYNDSTGQSPFSILYGRDAVLPIDNLLQPRRKYYGEEAHQILLEVQHEAFVRVHRRMKKQKERQAKYADRSAREIEFRVGDPVFVRNHKKTCKLSPSWEPYYRIIERVSPLTFRLKNQLTGEVIKSHAEHLILAKTEWEIKESAPNEQRRTRLRKVVSDEESDSEDNVNDNESEPAEEYDVNLGGQQDVVAEEDEQNRSEEYDDTFFRGRDSDLSEQHEVEPFEEEIIVDQSSEEPIEDEDKMQESFYSMDEESEGDGEEETMDLIRPFKRVRGGSSSEEDIPLAELSKRLRLRSERQNEIVAIRNFNQLTR